MKQSVPELSILKKRIFRLFTEIVNFFKNNIFRENQKKDPPGEFPHTGPFIPCAWRRTIIILICKILPSYQLRGNSSSLPRASRRQEHGNGSTITGSCREPHGCYSPMSFLPPAARRSHRSPAGTGIYGKTGSFHTWYRKAASDK